MVKVKFFAIIKNLAGKEDAQFDVGPSIKLKDLAGMIEKEFPKVGEMLRSKRVLVSVNQEIGSDEMLVKDGDEVGILPPFAGGSEGSPMVPMVRVQKDDFSVDEEINRVKASSGDIGGIVVFLGIGRGTSRGRSIKKLDFEHYPGMAERRLNEIREQALKDFDIKEVNIVHRVSEIGIGENIVLIIVGAAHRADAFKACKWCIDELKRITPIWKKETTPDGEIWVEEHP
ncbi:MAG: molybdenum cofactor biosynthesis protein MoaE [Nitrospirae bacterium]|nr:molybdenum cofactor biosynthesis protein MoaE [Nitrospirota bacterium]